MPDGHLLLELDSMVYWYGGGGAGAASNGYVLDPLVTRFISKLAS